MSLSDSDGALADEEFTILVASRADLSSPPRKRRRLNNNKTQAHESDDSSAEDNQSSTEENQYSDKENQTQINIKKNNKKRRRPLKSRNKPNANSTDNNNTDVTFNDSIPPGAICRLHLINFLCHSNFSIEFHPNVNIIYGQNGSGKSAVEAGISMALGQSSKKTGRGNNITDVIKFGEDFAVIQLYLHNGGPEKIPEFGRQILIERRLTRTGKNGVSNIKVMDSVTGKTCTKLRGLKAVRAISDQFNLNVDNPCVILKQSVAKRFLNSTKNTDKFKFFMQASKLQNYIDALNEARFNVREALQRQKQTKGSFTAIKTKYFEAKSRLETLEEMESQKEKVLFWERAEKYMVYHKESKTLHVYEERISSNGQKIESSQKTLEKLKGEIAEKGSKAKRVQKEIAEKMAETDEYTKPLNVLKKEQTGLDRQRQSLTRKVSSMQRYIDSGTRKIKKLMKEYDECVASIKNNERGQKLAAIQEKLKEYTAKIKTKRTERETLKHQTEKTIEMKEQEQQLREKQNELTRKKNEIDDARNQLKQLQQQSNRSESFLHPSLRNKNTRYRNSNEISVESIRLCIKRNRRKFQRLPIGPLGEYIQMRTDENNNNNNADNNAINNRNIQIVQQVLSKSLFVFLVDSSQDMQTFRTIMSKQFRKTVPCIKYAYSNVMDEISPNPFANRRDITRVSDLFVIRGNNAWVYNAILTNSGPERVYSNGSLEQAKKFLDSLNRAHLRCVSNMVTYERGGMYTVRKSGSGKGVSGTPCRPSNPILQADRSAAIQWYSNELNTKTQERANMQQCITELQRFVRQHEQSLREKVRKLKALNRVITTLGNGIEKLQRQQQDINEEEEEEDEAQGQMQELQNSIEDEKSQIESLREEIAPLKESEKELLLTISKTKLKLQALGDTIQSKRRSLNSDQTLFQKLMDDCNRTKKWIAQIPPKIAQFEQKLKGDREQYEEEKERVNDLLVAAQACGCGEEVVPDQYPRNPADRNRVFRLSDLKRSRKRLAAEIYEWENEPGNSNSDEIRRRFESIKPKYESHQQRVDNANKNCDEMNRFLHHRRKEYEMMKGEVSHQLSQEFRYIMKQQGHDGTLRVDYDTKELDMCVHMKSHDGAKQVMNSKTLSGGERSFTQVALIMALQKFSGAPMCIYDEFDVFMDSVNRGNSIKILLKAALGADKNEKESVGSCERQYIFITPNDVSPIIAQGHKNQIRIHKLQAPRRGE